METSGNSTGRGWGMEEIFEQDREQLTLTSGSAPAESSLFTMGTWFLHVAMWRAVSPKAFFASTFPPFFFSRDRAESSSLREPSLAADQISFREQLDETLRNGTCLSEPEGDPEPSISIKFLIMQILRCYFHFSVTFLLQREVFQTGVYFFSVTQQWGLAVEPFSRIKCFPWCAPPLTSYCMMSPQSFIC